MAMKTKEMKVEIWSDVTCPYCYMGKRNFENALSQFDDASGVEIIWKSFELAPGFKTQPDKNMHQLLSELKGIGLKQAIDLSDQVADAARQVGLEYNFHKAIPANSFNAHRLLHLARKHNLQDRLKESLFKAYFTDGRNIDDIPTLVELGEEIGLDASEVEDVLDSDWFSAEVNQDIKEAKSRGITSVPTFIFGDKLSLSGAHDSKAFVKLLEKVYAEWRIENVGSLPTVMDGQSCKIGEGC
jgi:predicted DsbA family dithiol-disulfide isomerase